MKDSACRQLDDYLGGELPNAERGRFESHLASCPSCHEQVAAFARLKSRLVSAVDREPCPSELVRRLELQILSRAAPERRSIRYGVAVAAAAACVVAWLMIGRNPQPSELPAPPNETAQSVVRDRSAAAPPSAPEPDEPTAGARARVELPDDYLAIPIETDDPRVTIIWIYATTDVSATTDFPHPSNPGREL